MSNAPELIEASEADIERFMTKVEKLPNGCWFWTGGRSKGVGNRKDYGTFAVGKTSIRAHRFSAEVLGGKVCPPGHHRDHTCGFSLCVNPDHLEVISKEENERRRWLAPYAAMKAAGPVGRVIGCIRIGRVVWSLLYALRESKPPLSIGTYWRLAKWGGQ